MFLPSELPRLSCGSRCEVLDENSHPVWPDVARRALSSPATAGLNGDIVTTALRAKTADYGRLSAVVGAGVEGSLVSGVLPFDYTDAGFFLSTPGNFCGIRNCGAVREQITEIVRSRFRPVPRAD